MKNPTSFVIGILTVFVCSIILINVVQHTTITIPGVIVLIFTLGWGYVVGAACIYHGFTPFKKENPAGITVPNIIPKTDIAIREEALRWWKCMDYDQKVKQVNEWRKMTKSRRASWTMFMISPSTATIEWIYRELILEQDFK